MLTKIALAAAIVAGTASFAFAEDSSSSFGIDIYPQATQRQVQTSRNVALSGAQHTVRGAQAGYDRASSPYAGGGF